MRNIFLAGLKRWPAVLAACLAWFLAAGCGGTGSSSTTTNASSGRSGVPPLQDTLRVGDMVEVRFSGTTSPPEDLAERIKEDGSITLPLVGSVPSANKTAGELQKWIQDAYVPKYYRRLTVTVRTENRVFFVEGEVQRPDRYIYTGEITVLKAIATAGGFSDFAARRRVELIRTTGERLTIDASRARDNPEIDVTVYPGDRISVPRRGVLGR